MTNRAGGGEAPPRSGVLLRRVFTLELDTRDANDDDRTVVASLSSETPVERSWGVEILEHSASAVNLERARNGGLVLLWQHDPHELVGRVEGIRLAGRRLRGRLRFGNSQRAQELWADVKAGLLCDVSIGYAIEEVEQTIDEENGNRVIYTATRWAPVEVSLVSIAADYSVGIGRSGEGIMTEPTTTGRPGLDVRENPNATRERERVLEIQAIARVWNAEQEGQRAISDGWPVADFQRWILKHRVPNGQPLETPTHGAEIGIEGRELMEYSIVRAARAFAHRDYSAAGLELEASRAVAKRIGREPRGFFVPYEVLAAPMRRDVEKGGTQSGAALVATVLLAGSFVELLRNRLMVRALGATVLPGLIADVEIPRQAGAATVQWLAEGGSVTASTSTYDVAQLAPKTVAARTNITRKMLLQSTPGIELLVRNDLAKVLAQALDLAAIAGTGAGNQPLGIMNTSGVGSVAIGANGGAPLWSHVVQLESEVANDNADQGALGYLTNSKVRSKLKTTEKAANTAEFIWEEVAGSVELASGIGSLNGYRAGVSNQVPSNLTKGSGTNLSAIIFGDWSSLLIGEWGILDLTSDPFTLGDQGGVVVRGFYDVDVTVRHPESFSVCSDAVTS